MFVRAAILLIGVTAGAWVNGAEPHRWRPFVSTKCGVTFSRPVHWTVDRGPNCSFVIRPEDYAERMRATQNVDTFSIQVETGVGSFEDAAEASNFYKPKPDDDLSPTEKEHVGEWLCTTGQVPGIAQPADHPSYRGFQCGLAARCYHEGGGYVGQCDWFFGFVSSGGRWLSVSGFDSGIPQAILHGVTLASAATSPEVEVIQTVSRDILFRAKEAPAGNYLLIESRTAQFEFTKNDEARAVEAGIPAVLLRALADRPPHDMQFFPETSDLRQIEPAEIARIFADGPRWDRFYARFPKSRGFVQFSGPVFNAEQTAALLWVDFNCHGDCGWGSVVYLKRKDGKWVKTSEWLRYIS